MSQYLVPASGERSNPYNDDGERSASYLGLKDGKLTHLLKPRQAVSALEEFVHEQFRGLVLSSKFTCVGAKAAFHKNEYRMAVYGEMGTPDVTRSLARDLVEFIDDQDHMDDDFTTFIATFEGPSMVSEEHFEMMLWHQLQALHDLDYRYSDWDGKVGSNPDHGDFSFSFGGRAYFIIGLHPGSSRFARRFAWPTLVFNAHRQFEALRKDGRFERMQGTIRDRDVTLQGTMNETLANYGDASEARTYSGRVVEDGWRCPFHARTDTPQVKDTDG